MNKRMQGIMKGWMQACKTQTHQLPLARSSIPRSACVESMRHSSSPSSGSWHPCCCWRVRSSRTIHCASARSAIQVFFLANARRGTLAGFYAEQSKVCVCADRLRHRRLQEHAAHAPEAKEKLKISEG